MVVFLDISRTKVGNVPMLTQGFERGFEHLEQLTGLSSKSSLIKHMLDRHEEEDMSDVKFGMTIVRYARTAFERQIGEAVLIQQEKEKHELLNSRAEYNACSLPRLTTRMGDQDMEAWEKEIREEKDNEERIEAKLTEMRKVRKRARLNPDNPKPKKRKFEEQYISIREVGVEQTR